MKKAIVIVGAVVIGIVVVLALFLPLITGSSNNASMGITFYDEEGNEVGTASSGGLLGLGIREDGGLVDVYSVLVRVDYIITTDIAHANRVTRAHLEVKTTLNTITGGHVHTVPEHSMGFSSALEGFVESTYLMSELLPESAIESTGKANGWNMNFNVRVKTTLTLDDNSTREVEDTCTIMLRLTWSEQLKLESWVSLP